MPKRRRARTSIRLQEISSIVAPDLPNELLDHIISFLSIDRQHFKLLAELTLMSKTWYSLVRPYIFRSVWLDSEIRAQELVQKLDECPAMGHWIREVHLQWPGPGFRHWEIFTGQSSLKAERLKNLRALYFDNAKSPKSGLHPAWILPPAHEAALAHGLGKLTTVHELSILTSQVNMALVVCFMRCLPSLRSVYANGLRDDVGHYWHQDISLSHGTAPRLAYAHFDSIPLCHLLFPLMHSVRELRLEFSPSRYGYTYYVHSLIHEWKPENLRDVQKLTLERVYARHGECLTLLHKLKALPIEELVIKGSFSDPHKIKHIHDLDSSLVSPGFSSLKCIRFVHQGDATADHVERKLRKTLLALRTRNIVLEVVKVMDVSVYELHA